MVQQLIILYIEMEIGMSSEMKTGTAQSCWSGKRIEEM
jgi:hypothetical protein